MIFDANELAQAVLFFSDSGELTKQMHIAEFEAVLDGYVPLSDFSGQFVRSCYVEFDVDFYIQRVVCFKLPVNRDGEIDQSWKMPLFDLAASGIKSLDLGGGCIRLVCESQAPSPHIRHQLWNPSLSPESNHLKILKLAIKDNTLGIQFRSENRNDNVGASSGSLVERAALEREVSRKLRKEYAQEFRDHVAQLLKEQRLRMASCKHEYQEREQDLKDNYDERLAVLKRRLEEAEKEVFALRDSNRVLQVNVDGQLQKITALREYYEGKLIQSESVDEQNAAKEQRALEAECQTRFDEKNAELAETLQQREVELLYRNELEVQLQSEIVRLKEACLEAMESAGEQLLSRIMESGITLVAFQPGAGHLTIPVSEVSRYLDNSTLYVAEHCNVHENRYVDWLAHYRMPVCQYPIEGGDICGENVIRVEKPIDFFVGESDCCPSCRTKKVRPHLRLAGS